MMNNQLCFHHVIVGHSSIFRIAGRVDRTEMKLKVKDSDGSEIKVSKDDPMLHSLDDEELLSMSPEELAIACRNQFRLHSIWKNTFYDKNKYKAYIKYGFLNKKKWYFGYPFELLLRPFCITSTFINPRSLQKMNDSLALPYKHQLLDDFAILLQCEELSNEAHELGSLLKESQKLVSSIKDEDRMMMAFGKVLHEIIPAILFVQKNYDTKDDDYKERNRYLDAIIENGNAIDSIKAINSSMEAEKKDNTKKDNTKVKQSYDHIIYMVKSRNEPEELSNAAKSDMARLNDTAKRMKDSKDQLVNRVSELDGLSS